MTPIPTIRSMAETLEARADADQPLAPAEMRGLALMLHRCADALEQRERIVSLRPVLSVVQGGRAS